MEFWKGHVSLETRVSDLIVSVGQALEKSLCEEGTGTREARLLVAHALGVSVLGLMELSARPLGALPSSTQDRLESLCIRRLKGEPLSRIRGAREFWKGRFLLSPETLDPRPETEGLIQMACAFFSATTPPLKIVDLGTGTGCLLISLLQEFPQSLGWGIDCSEGALSVARQNAVAHDVAQRCHFIKCNWLEGIEATFDLIVANPPYIPTQTIADLCPGVKDYDPLAALDGGADGLAAFRAIIPAASCRLSSQGALLLEIGSDQKQAVEKLLKDCFPSVAFVKDLAGRPRYAGGFRGTVGGLPSLAPLTT